jgi:hypothetical protein
MNIPKNIPNRSSKYLCSFPMYDVKGINEFREMLKREHGVTAVQIRGRHSNRKSVLGAGWRAGTQNDIPWKQAEWVAFYAR